MTIEATQDQVTDEVSMDETIAAALKDIQSRDIEDSDNSAEPEKRPVGRPRKEMSAETETQAGHEKPANSDEKPAEKTDESELKAIEKPAEPVSTTPPPNSLTASAKEEWAKWPKSTQDEFIRRDKEIYRGIQQYKAAAEYGQNIHKAIAPFENTIRQLGVTPDVAIKALFNADHTLRNGSPSQKMEAFAKLAQGYGIDLSQGLPEQQAIDPNISYMQTELQRTQQEIQNLRAAQIRREQQQAQHDQSILNSEIERAKQGKPHFDELQYEIGALLQAAIHRGQEITIDQAYEAALYASPRYREELLAKQLTDRQAMEAKKRSEEVAKQTAAAAEAKRAAATNVSRRGTLPAQAPIGSMDDTIRAALRDIQNR